MSNNQDGDKNTPAAPQLVTLDDFTHTNIEAPIENEKKISPHHLSFLYARAAKQAESNGAIEVARVYALLSRLCEIHLRPEDRAKPWGANLSTARYRTAIPSDFKGAQNTVLAESIGKIINPGLRARLADVVWTNDRKLVSIALTAIEAYRQSAEGLLTEAFAPYADSGPVSFEALDYITRGLRVSHETSKKDGNGRSTPPQEMVDCLLKMYALAKKESAYVLFVRVAELGMYYGILDDLAVAKDCETVACSGTSNTPMAPKATWKLGIRIYEGLKNNEGLRRCRIGSMEKTLEMRKQVSGAGAEAHWVQHALLEMRHIDGLDEIEKELLLDLRRLQRESLKQMGTFSTSLDVTDEVRNIVEVFSKLTFPEAMRHFGLLSRSPSVKKLKEEALQSYREFPLQGLMTQGHLDREGKPIAISPSASNEEEQNDDWFRAQALRNSDFRRQHAVAGYIEPARLIIHERFQIEERHLELIVCHTPFVPSSQAPIVTLGLTRYIQGDFMSAAHLLISQIEPCFRHLLKTFGHDPIRRFDDGTEQDYDLNEMFKRMRPQLESIFGEDMVFEMDVLFTGRPGPSLRNDLSHGQISAFACFSPTVLYGCWMIYRLCIGFLDSVWDQLAPELASVE